LSFSIESPHSILRLSHNIYLGSLTFSSSFSRVTLISLPLSLYLSLSLSLLSLSTSSLSPYSSLSLSLTSKNVSYWVIKEIRGKLTTDQPGKPH
jgi:hypothetical protein